MANCAFNVDGIPVECRLRNSFTLMQGWFLTVPGFQFDTVADAGDIDNWIAGIIAGNIFPLHKIEEVEDMTGEDVTYESASQRKKLLFEGVTGFKASFDLTVDQHAVLRTYRNKNFKLFYYDRSNNIIGTSPDGTIVKGLSVSYLNPEKLPTPTADTPVYSKVEMRLENAAEHNEFRHVIVPNEGTVANRWIPTDDRLNSVTTVTVVNVSVAANVATFNVAYTSSRETDNDGNPISISGTDGLDVTTFTNFVFTDGSATVVPTGMTEVGIISNKYCQYTATFTTFTTGTVRIVPTTSNLYKSAETALS